MWTIPGMNRTRSSLQWDIFCKVIDNFGDIGICWRLAADLASRGQRVRLWVDDASALAWMAPAGCEDVCVLPWTVQINAVSLATLDERLCDVLIEAFGCEPAAEFIAACARIKGAAGIKPVWINLEYLSAEAYAERNHTLPSPVQSGPAAGWTKWFFYPGFSAQTGGLLREPDLARRQGAFQRENWLANQGIDWRGETLVSMFCYEPPALAGLLRELAAAGLDGQPVRLLVAAGRTQRAVEHAMTHVKVENNNEKGLQPPVYGRNLLSISYLPLISQADFDHLLWACDVNFVRGEDSVVRALWAGKPFIWQIYPQDDGAHRVKLDAFLDMLAAPPSLREFHHTWNAGESAAAAGHGLVRCLAGELPAWQQSVQACRERLLRSDDLTSKLLRFVAKSR